MEIRKRIVGIIFGFIFIIVIIAFYRTFSLGDDYQMSSDVYEVEDGYIKGISPYTTIDLFLNYFDLNNCYLKVVGKENKEITTGYVYNGSRTLLYDDGNNIISSYVNIIKGDYYADGVINDKDYSFIGKYLVDGNGLEEYDRKSLDINDDNEIKINDLILLYDAVNNGIQELSINKKEILLQTNEKDRLVVSSKPNYGTNTNMRWSSSNNSIATVDQNGIVTGGTVEGTTVIRAESQDGKKYVEAIVVLDNTIQLESVNGTGYVNGNDVSVNIKSVTYDDLGCEVLNSDVASCRIAGKKLIMTALADGNAEVRVTSNKYRGATYYLQSHSVYFRVFANYACLRPNGGVRITVSGFYSGDLSFASTDSTIVRDARMEVFSGRNMLRLTAGNTAGRAEVTVTEGNANTSSIITVDVYTLSLGEAGKLISLGETVTIPLNGENVGNLTCSSNKEEIATCSIDNGNLIVTGTGVGSTSINISNSIVFEGQEYNCSEGIVPFVAVVRE